MFKFPSIESLRHVVDKVRANAAYHGIEPPAAVPYVGTVKLHGTNAGVNILTDGTVTAQGRNSVLTVQQDNFGFAAFVHARVDLFRDLADGLNCGVTFYGEWIGRGIQKGVAVSQLDKQFVIFSYRFDDDDLVFPIETYGFRGPFDDDKEQFNTVGIYFINQVPEYEVTIDFRPGHLEEAADKISELTLEVERKCPWGAMFGVEGTGEGIVWRMRNSPGDASRWFKSKGLEHKKVGPRAGKVDIDPVKAQNITELVEVILPKWRLEQGISELEQRGLTINPENTGEFIKWIHQDILKEEVDHITKSGYSWKDVVGTASKKAKDFYFSRQTLD